MLSHVRLVTDISHFEDIFSVSKFDFRLDLGGFPGVEDIELIDLVGIGIVDLNRVGKTGYCDIL